MVLTERDHIDAKLVSQHRLVDHLPDRGGKGDGLARVVLGHVAERVQTELQVWHGYHLRN